MVQVQSVLGPIDSGELGRTLVHEHAVVGFDGVALDGRWAIDREAVVQRARSVLEPSRELGLRTMVDATVIEMSRHPELLVEIAERTGVNIVCTSGLYTSDHGIPMHFREQSAEDLAALYVQELTEGIGQSRVRSGVIKVATSGEVPSPVEEKVMAAAAIAQQATGVPIITHTTGGGGDRQASALLEHGVSPDAIVIGHVDHKNSSYRYLARILRSGVSIAFDRVGNENFLPDLVRAGLAAALVKGGYRDRFFLSMDSTATWIGPTDSRMKPAETPCLHLLERFIPMLRDFGLGDSDIDAVLVDNPRRLFERAHDAAAAGER